MKKVFLLVFFYFLFFSQSFSYEKPEIISRASRGANENYTYLDSPEWQKILKLQEEEDKISLTDYEEKIAEIAERAEDFISSNFKEQLKTYGYITRENGNTLAWPIQFSTKIRAITIHHTESEYADTITGLHQILYFHAITRRRGDIGYNFIIGYDGKIYEGRKGGETAVGAHVKYNNIQNIGISIMGSYTDKDISDKQQKSLEELVNYLVEKYNIDMTEKQVFFKKCFTDDCAMPIRLNYEFPLIGHRDAGNTDCPGDKLYADVKNMRTKIMFEQINYNKAKEKYFPVFEKVEKEKLVNLSKKIDIYLSKNENKEFEKVGRLLKDYLS